MKEKKIKIGDLVRIRPDRLDRGILEWFPLGVGKVIDIQASQIYEDETIVVIGNRQNSEIMSYYSACLEIIP